MYEFEYEAIPESEWETEFEAEYEGELEGEEFIGALRRLAGRALAAGRQQLRPGSPLRRVALGAARQVVQRGLPALGGWAGGRLGQNLGGRFGALAGPEGAAIGAAAGQSLGDEGGTALGQMAVPTALSWIPEQEYEFEYEGEGEYEGELEGEVNPIRRVYSDALMEHLGHAAAEAENEEEAEAFIGALIPLAARLIPRAAPAIVRAAPGLIRGLTGATRALRRSSTTRPLVRAIPTIVRQTAANIARQTAQGAPVTPQAAVRTLARQTAGVLSSPRQCARAYQRSRALDQRYHQATSAAVRGAAPGMAAETMAGRGGCNCAREFEF
jgi:hypothetical protein